MKKKLVVSAVNFTEGGPLTVLQECLACALETLGADWEVIALVNHRRLIDIESITVFAFPACKKSWFTRLYYEFFGFQKLSTTLKADLWLSLHDITPTVSARRRVVYCHNSAPFYRLSFREAWLEPTLLVFNKLYGFVYRLNIQKNDHVIVQQEWLRTEFVRRYNAPAVIVAHPVASPPRVRSRKARSGKVIFLYPALPRVFKNFESILQATTLLNQRGVVDFEVQLTIDGSENRYAKGVLRKFGDIERVVFIGRQSKQDMALRLTAADCLLFPSRLETWGLPISEAKALAMPMLIADLPYAHETVGSYDAVRFFPPDDAVALANLMEQVVSDICEFPPVHATAPAAPFAQDWPSLLKILVHGL